MILNPSKIPDSEWELMAQLTREWLKDFLPEACSSANQTALKALAALPPALQAQLMPHLSGNKELAPALAQGNTITVEDAVAVEFSSKDVVEVKFVKTHPDAQLPSKAYSDGDNCFDLYCCEDTVVPPTTTTKEMVALSAATPYGYTVKIGSALVPVGLKVAYITPGFGFVVKDKSGLGFKYQLSHYGGEIDNGYRGDMGIKIANYSDEPYTFHKGDKVAQIKIEKIWKTEISFVDEVVPVDCPRGEGGFGSSGK